MSDTEPAQADASADASVEAPAPPSSIAMSTTLLATALLLGIGMLGALNYAAFLGDGGDAGIVAQMLLPLGQIDLARRNVINAATLNGFYLFFALFALLFALLFGFYYKFLLRGAQDAKAATGVAACLAAGLGAAFVASSPLVAPYVDAVRVFENTVGFAVLQSTHGAKLRTVLDLMYTNDAYARAQPLPLASVSHNFMATLFDIFEFRKTLSLLGREGQSAFDFHACGDEEIWAKALGGPAVDAVFGARAGRGMDKAAYRADLAIRREQYDPRVLAAVSAASGGLKLPGDAAGASEALGRSAALQDALARELAKMVLLKQMVGHLCWVYAAALASSLVALKYLAQNR